MLPSSLPSARVIDPASVTPLRWGIIGPGWIAANFADAVHKYTTQRIVAVASKTPGRGEEFAAPRGIEIVLDSYEALVAHPDVDVIYVATTHEFHKEHALLAIAAGKHVLIEKPCAISKADVEEIAAQAKAAGVIAMEAMWTRYLPQTDVIRQVVSEGILGDISLVVSDFGQDLRGVPRCMSSVSGGALLDLGIYNFAFTSLVLGNATSVTTSGKLTLTGVDETSTTYFSYAGAARAVATVSLATYTPTAASISGDNAVLTVDTPFFTPTALTLYGAEFNAKPVARWEDESGIREHEGLGYQATALASYVDQGLLDSPVRPLAEVASDIGLIESARHQIGAFLDGEKRS
jgi:predicted dehydrogenase